MKPTDEQIRELWEQCGLHKHILSEVDYTAEMPHWKCITCGEKFYPEGYCGRDSVPNPLDMDIDLNNLWEYVVPVFIDKIMAEQKCSSDVAYAILFKRWLQELKLNMTEPADSLFSVIFKALGGKE